MRTIIQYEDKHIIVAYKPAGLATQTARVGQADMVSELKNYLKGGFVGVVHRLDQPVEGLLVFAKTKPAAAALSRQLENGVLNKHYYAVVCGKPECERGELVDYLRKTADNRAEIVDVGRMVMENPEAETEWNVVAGQKTATERKEVVKRKAVTEQHAVAKQMDMGDAKLARLQYEVLVYSKQAGISLLDIHIETGRFHQIRAQMAHAGLPLLGDAKYGTSRSAELSREYNVRNVALCACELECMHPVTGKALHFTVEPQGTIFHCEDFGKRIQRTNITKIGI